MSYVLLGFICLGAASVARAWTANFDALINNTIKNSMLDCCKMDTPGLAPYPDLFSFMIVLILTGRHTLFKELFRLILKSFLIEIFLV